VLDKQELSVMYKVQQVLWQMQGMRQPKARCTLLLLLVLLVLVLVLLLLLVILLVVGPYRRIWTSCWLWLDQGWLQLRLQSC